MLSLNAATKSAPFRCGLVIFIILASLIYYQAFHSPVKIVFKNKQSSHASGYFSPNAAERLPHIPPKVWQIWLEFISNAPDYYADSSLSFVKNPPSHSYTVVDGPGAISLLTTLSGTPRHARLLPIYHAMPRRVLRADFLRYLLLAVEGGVYSDIDVEMLRPAYEWVPEEYKDKARLIVGIEGDSDNPEADGQIYQVQFCMWTIVSSANHPVIWNMVNHIADALESRPPSAGISDQDILSISGPQGWSKIVYEGISEAAGREINFTHLRGLQEPVLFGDILILPIDAFSAHFDDPVSANKAFVKHAQASSWRGSADIIG